MKEEGNSTSRHLRGLKASEGEHTFTGPNQTSPCLCKIFEGSLHNQERIRH